MIRRLIPLSQSSRRPAAPCIRVGRSRGETGRKFVLTIFAAFALLGSIGSAIAQVPAPVPALSDSERRMSYSITASQCNCSVNFQLFGDSNDFQNWIEVWVNNVRQVGNWTITSPTGPLGNIARPITDAVLTFNTPQTGTIQIVGARRPRRASQFQENNGVATRNFNVVLSDIVAMLREVWDKINDVTGRGLFFPPGFTSGPLPPPSDCANSFLTFGSSGSYPICVSTSGGILPSGNIQTVGSEVVLAACATTSFPNGVWRLDFSAGLGAPPLFYVPSVGACSLNAGAGDGGSQVPSSNGKCWLAKFGQEADIRQWGADPTGTADSSAAFNSALTSMASTGGISTSLAGPIRFRPH
jgi:hypothetical protein